MQSARRHLEEHLPQGERSHAKALRQNGARQELGGGRTRSWEEMGGPRLGRRAGCWGGGEAQEAQVRADAPGVVFISMGLTVSPSLEYNVKSHWPLIQKFKKKKSLGAKTCPSHMTQRLHFWASILEHKGVCAHKDLCVIPRSRSAGNGQSLPTTPTPLRWPMSKRTRQQTGTKRWCMKLLGWVSGCCAE